MAIEIYVENIKCGGCAGTIKKRLLEDPRVTGVDVGIEEGRVSLEADESGLDDYTKLLTQLGYPERGSVEGLKAAAAKAKSFVSCAVGRLDSQD